MGSQRVKMEQLLVAFCLLVLVGANQNDGGMRLPPGVNPTHYQQPGQMPHQVPNQPPQQQQFQGQQQHQQYQQASATGQGQFQQPPGQQQQFHQPTGQQQQQQQFQSQQGQQFQGQQGQQFQSGHGHGHGGHAHGGQHFGGQNILDASQISKDKDHLKEHMEVPLDVSQMSEQELQFHYFKMHDADNNNKLDGSELVKSLIHWHDQANHNPNSGMPIPEEKIFKDEELISLIDPILANDDKNGDGFIDYSEFVQAQQAAQARAAAENAKHS